MGRHIYNAIGAASLVLGALLMHSAWKNHDDTYQTVFNKYLSRQETLTTQSVQDAKDFAKKATQIDVECAERFGLGFLAVAAGAVSLTREEDKKSQSGRDRKES